MSRRLVLITSLLAVAVVTALVAWWSTRAPSMPAVSASMAPLVRTLQFSARVATQSRETKQPSFALDCHVVVFGHRASLSPVSVGQASTRSLAGVSDGPPHKDSTRDVEKRQLSFCRLFAEPRNNLV